MSDRVVYVAGATGPDASGGAVALAYVLVGDGGPLAEGTLFMPPSVDGSWHSATYHALAFALEQCRGRLGSNPTFVTDNEMVVKQMTGLLGVKGGHYVGAREDAIEALVQAFPSKQSKPAFKQVRRSENLAASLCSDMLEKHDIDPWTYKKKSPVEGIELILDSGASAPWEDVKEHAKSGRVSFGVAGDLGQIEFYLGPDIFPGSYVLAWTTPEERVGGTFLDSRCRSNDPDDFVSRIMQLVTLPTHA
jgi:hypothetical protein